MSEESNQTVFGIDLGTTYSCIAWWNSKRNEPEIQKPPTEKGDTLSSVVYVKDQSDWIVGERAEQKQIGKDFASVVSFAKNDIALDEACDTKKYPRGDYPTKDGVELGPIQISAAILEALTKRNPTVMEKTGGQPVSAVITVPAYFTKGARERTRQAGELAGINVIDILEEPVAAALSYGNRMDAKNKTVMVYDLGGGTFDVSIVSFDENGRAGVLIKEGDPNCGGRNWDNEFGYYIWKKFCKEVGIDVAELKQEDFEQDAENEKSRKLAHQFRAYAKRIKEGFSPSIQSVEEAIKADDEEEDLEFTLDEFNEQTENLLNYTLGMVDSITEKFKNKYPDKKLDSILLVGGSTLMPQVKDALAEKFGDLDIRLEEPHYAVAKGAAIYADLLNKRQTPGLPPGPRSDDPVGNIASMSYGVGCNYRLPSGETKEAIAVLVAKDDNLPAEGEELFAVGADGATCVNIEIYESIRIPSDPKMKMLQLNDGVLVTPADEPFMLNFNQPKEKGYPVVVKFHMDASGNLRIIALDGKDLSNKLDFELKFKGTLSKDEIEDSKRLFL